MSVLMDIQLPGMSGIACTAALKQKLPALRVMMLTVYEDSDAIFDALKAGASGYLLKRSGPVRLLEAIKELHQGGAPMTSEIARKVIDSFHITKLAPHPQDQLTAREEEVLQYLAKGMPARKSPPNCAFPTKPCASTSGTCTRNSTSIPAPKPC